jgi:hypothetical protein
MRPGAKSHPPPSVDVGLLGHAVGPLSREPRERAWFNRTEDVDRLVLVPIEHRKGFLDLLSNLRECVI